MSSGIRRATPSDASGAAELMILARHEAVPSIPPPVHTDPEIREWFTGFVMAEQDVWLATADDQIEAVLVTSEGWIEHLYVHPSKTGRGIGTRMVNHAKSLGGDELQLWTFVSNTGAQRFYERHAFVEVERTQGDNEEKAPDIKYRWRRAAAGDPFTTR